MKGTDLFIQRPVLAVVISLLILLLGAMGYQQLAVRETPDVQSPVVTVTTVWPGADPAIVESDLTEVLERELNGIEGVRTITSTSTEGSSSVTVEFDLDRDLEAAANDVRSRVARARRRLPTDVEEPTVEKADASAQPVMFLRLASEAQDLLDITDVADTIVRDRLENVEGVSGVDMFGAQRYAMRLELDAARMAARHVVVADVEAALRAGNVDLPAGRIEGAAMQLTLHVEGGLRTGEEFGGLVVRAAGPARVYLRDVATIRLGAENERTSARADGFPSISVAITPQAKANIIDVSDEVRSRLDSVRADLPVGMTLEVVYDRGDAVRASIRDVEHTLFIAFGLVVAVIFAFLRDWRSTLVPAVAIPVSIVGTFLVLWIAGFTINVFTLFGLVLAIGLVVDDAIVVLENIVRRVEEGEPVLEASTLGTRQIAFAVVATTLSLVAVFLPVIFTGGTTGRLFLEFGTTVAASVAVSMVVALTLTPMLCSKVLRAGGPRHAGPGLLARVFARTLRVVMRRPWIVVPVLLGSLLVGASGFYSLPREFFPTEDRNIFLIRTQAQEGASFPWMDARMKEVETALMPLVPERRIMLSRVGVGPGGVAAGTNTGMIIFGLVPHAERDRSQQDIIAALRAPLAQVTVFRTIPIQFPTVGRGFSPPLQFVLQNPDFDALAAELPKFLQAMRALPGLSSVNEDLRLDRPELWAHVDREKAGELGVPLRDVARTLQVLTSGLELSTFKRGVRQYKVLASLPIAARDAPSDLAGIYLRARDGGMVSLANLVRFDERVGAASRFHYARAPSATLSANLDGITVGEGIARVQALADATLPAGFRTALAGESRDFAESSASLAGMFLLALALVYLLLSAQFDSFVAPVSIMLSVPLALAGAFGALAALGMTLSFFGQVGLILLVGLVTKNGILIVEYAKQLGEHEGIGPWEAAEKAAQLRFRPILMTSVATIGGALPIALGLSGSSRASLGVAVVGGMITATVLTLYVTPVVYAALAGRRPSRGLAAAALALFVAAWPARAEEPLDLPAALRIAMEGNLPLRQAETGVRASEASADAARGAYLPSAYATAGALYGTDDVAGGAGALGTAALHVTAPLLDLSALADGRAARLDAHATAADFDTSVEATLQEVSRRFVALQEARESVVSAESQRVHAARLATVARDRVEIGAAPSIDATRAELQLRLAEARAITASTAEERARLALVEALGQPIGAPIDVVVAAPLVAGDTLPTDADLDRALASAREERPDLVAARVRLEQATSERRAVGLAGLPTVDAYGEVGARVSGAGTSPTGVAGVTATLPLFEGGARMGTLRARRATEEGESIALAEAERAIEVDLRASLRTARDAAAVLDVSAATVALAAEELARAESRYREGAGDNLAVVGAQATLADASQRRVAALADYNLAVVAWYAARGQVRSLAR